MNRARRTNSRRLWRPAPINGSDFGSEILPGSAGEITWGRRCCCATRYFKQSAPLLIYPNFNPLQPDAAPGWRNSNHFANCSNFEQSLLKKVTRRKRWSTDKGSGWPQGEVWWSKSREEPWRAQAASPRQSRSNPIFRGNRVDTIFEQGLRPALFSLERGLRPAPFFQPMPSNGQSGIPISFESRSIFR
jgi:hypothetical protein